MKSANKSKKGKEIPKTMTDTIQDYIKDGVSKQDARLKLAESFPDSSADSIRTMVSKAYAKTENSASVSPRKTSKTLKKEEVTTPVVLQQVSDSEVEPEPSEPAVVDESSDTASE